MPWTEPKCVIYGVNSFFLMCLREDIFCYSRWKLLEKEHISSTSLVFFFSKPFYIHINRDVFCESHILYGEQKSVFIGELYLAL